MSKLSRFIREKVIKHYRIKGKNNRIFLKENGHLKPLTGRLKGLDIEIVGNDNKIIIEKPTRFDDTSIRLTGSNALFEIKKTKYEILHTFFAIGSKGARVFIDEDFSCAGAKFYLGGGDFSSLTIGKDCMFSDNIIIMNSDSHAVLDNKTRKIINNDTINMTIGNHVWLGRRVTVLKRAKIPSNTIVGLNSFVIGQFNKENTVIAGNPAKVVKEEIDWQR